MLLHPRTMRVRAMRTDTDTRAKSAGHRDALAACAPRRGGVVGRSSRPVPPSAPQLLAAGLGGEVPPALRSSGELSSLPPWGSGLVLGLGLGVGWG